MKTKNEDKKPIETEILKNEKTASDLEALKRLLSDSKGRPKTEDKPGIFKKIISYILIGFQSIISFLDDFISLILNKNPNRIDSVLLYTRKPIVSGYYLILIFVIGGGIWAATAPLDSATVAIGSVVFAGHKKTVQHAEGGMVKDILVKVGEFVKKGDPIIVMDDTKARTKYARDLSLYRSQAVLVARLEAERDNLEKINYPDFILENINDPEVQRLTEVQDKIFKGKREYIISNLNINRTTINSLNEQIKLFKTQRNNLQESFAIVVEKVKSLQKLSQKQIVSKAELSDSLLREIDLRSKINTTSNEITRSEQEIKKTELESIRFQNSQANEVLKELKESQIQLAAAREHCIESKEVLDRTIVRATEDGTINEINVYTKGSVIGPGQTVAEISPASEKDDLIIEAKIDPKDITRISEGNKVKIKFSAFKSRTSPIFLGKVKNISADIIMDKTGRGMVSQSGRPQDTYYLAMISIDMDSFEKYPELKSQLRPGLTAEVGIITGERTLLRYLLAPLEDQMFRAFTER